MTTTTPARWAFAQNRNEHADHRTHATADGTSTLCGKAVHTATSERVADLTVALYGPPACRRCREALS